MYELLHMIKASKMTIAVMQGAQNELICAFNLFEKIYLFLVPKHWLKFTILPHKSFFEFYPIG